MVWDKKTYGTPRGIDKKRATEMVHVFNNNSEKKSPTTASDTFKPQRKETFGITKKWQNEGPH